MVAAIRLGMTLLFVSLVAEAGFHLPFAREAGLVRSADPNVMTELSPRYDGVVPTALLQANI